MTGGNFMRDAQIKQSLSEFLARLELRGRSWCYVDVRAASGFSVPQSDAIFFHAVMHGTARLVDTRGTSVELRAGDVAIVLSGRAHALRARADSAVRPLDFFREERNVDVPPTLAVGDWGPIATRVLSGRLKVNWPSGLLSSLPAFLRLGSDSFTADSSLVKPAAMQLAGVGVGAAVVLTRLASLLLIGALRTHPQCVLLFRAPHHDPIAHSLRLIASDPSVNWTVARLAKQVGMGRSNFAAKFTAQVGRAPMQVIIEERMQHAAGLLGHSALSIVEIGALSGYRSEAAFSRRFTRHFGVAPSQLRENVRANDAARAPSLIWQPLLPSGRLKDNPLPRRPRASRGAAVLHTKLLQARP